MTQFKLKTLEAVKGSIDRDRDGNPTHGKPSRKNFHHSPVGKNKKYHPALLKISPASI